MPNQQAPNYPDPLTSSELDLGSQYLITEFQIVRALKDQSVSISDRRLDLHLGLSSAFAGGMALLSQTHLNSKTFLYILIIGTTSLLLIGLSTFRQVVERDILIVDYIRAGNRIRAYFADNAPKIRPYLLMPTSHKYPSYKWQSSNRIIAVVLNSAAAATLLTTLYVVIFQDTSLTDIPTIALASSTFLVTYVIQFRTGGRRYKKAEKKARSAGSVNLSDEKKAK